MDINKDSDNWTNDDLQGYYDGGLGAITELNSFAEIAGLNNGCDINLISTHLQKAHSILEIGAGYGRAIKNILNKDFKGTVTAIERSQTMSNYLKENFKDKIEIIHRDIQNYQFNKKFDIVLLLWSHIAEYPQKQQADILKISASLLNEKGVVIVDNGVPVENAENDLIKTPEFYHLHGQSYMINSDYGMLCGYVPSPNEMHAYAKEAGFFKIEQKYYLTEKKRPRISYVFYISESN